MAMITKNYLRLRTLVLIISLFSIISTTLGGVYFYYSLRESSLDLAKSRAKARIAVITNQIGAFLELNRKPARTLAGFEQIRRAVHHSSAPNLEQAELILDLFEKTLDVEACYLIHKSGITLTSSNRNRPDSFVGQDYTFRPYFLKAANGHPVTYLALGTVSHKRGAYYSHPVRNPADGEVAGVVVIKAPIIVMEQELLNSSEGITMLVGPHSVIFSSSRKDWLYRTLWETSPQEIDSLKRSLQFGTGPWPWVGLTRTGQTSAEDRDGRRYLLYSATLPGFPLWQMVYLQALDDISSQMLQPLARITGYLVLGICLLAGLGVYLLYRKASHEITRRLQAESELRTARDQLDEYSRDLEGLVESRTKELHGFMQHTPALVYSKDRAGKYTFVNSRHHQLFGGTDHSVLGKTLFDILPHEVAERISKNDAAVLSTGRALQTEERIPAGGEWRTFLSVRFPVFGPEGAVSRVCGISLDISEVKKAQEQLRRMSGAIIDSQEKERAVIARELHDELGQMLTALKMDAVWLVNNAGVGSPLLPERIQGMCALIDHTIDQVRNVSTRLRPALLDDLGLSAALEWQAKDFEERTGITCRFSSRLNHPLAEHTTVAIYRVAQEALTNVARHARAEQVEMHLQMEEAELVLTVQDDGRGFDSSREFGEKDLGLAGMQERASLIGGQLEIASRAGSGTKVTLKVSLDKPKEGSK